MLVFRFETTAGVGMYFNDSSTGIIGDGSSHPTKWPMPDEDERFSFNKKFHIKSQYPDNEMLSSSTSTIPFVQWDDLARCGLFEFYEDSFYRFGFGSYQQLENWVYQFDWRKQLAVVNVFLNVYEVDETYAILGFTQCTFRLDKAKRLHSFIATTSEDQIIATLKSMYPDSEHVEAYYQDFLL